jgi:fatty-acid peroxygenase
VPGPVPTVADHPTHVLIDQTLGLMREGYEFLPNRRRRYGSDVYEIRLLGRRAICLVGPEAAELLYDDSRFQRAGAMLGPIRATLVGKGGVQELDGAAHQGRKAMFMTLTTHIETLVDLTASYWREAMATWRGPVVLFDEAARVFARAGCDWTGLPLPAEQVGARTRDLVAMVDGFGTAGRRHWRARVARRRSEAWAAGAQAEQFRGLDRHTAAVELLNLVRPLVAIAWYVAFAAHALHEHPQWRAKLSDEEALGWFVDEVRRFYPFTPALAARVRESFSWHGHRFRRGRLVLVDVPGTHRDPRIWTDPDTFDPLRFAGREVSGFEFIPQGGGDPWEGHRCAGELVTVELLKTSLRELLERGYLGHGYEVPPQDLTIPMDRIPTLPRSGFVLSER